MEIAGLGLGVAGLASIFNDAIDCFEYVQLGRNFGLDYQTSLLQLDLARLKLSRWGESVGLTNDLTPPSQEEQAAPRDEQARQISKEVCEAKMILGQILTLFEKSELVSKKFQGSRRNRPNETDLAVHQLSELPVTAADLHRFMREQALNRQRRATLKQKIRWALYDGKAYNNLIEEINKLVNDLVGLFSDTRQTQVKLCAKEVDCIDNSESLALLKTVCAKQDASLEEAVTKALQDRNAQYMNISFGGNSSGLQLVHNSGTMSGFTFGKNS